MQILLHHDIFTVLHATTQHHQAARLKWLQMLLQSKQYVILESAHAQDAGCAEELTLANPPQAP